MVEVYLGPCQTSMVELFLKNSTAQKMKFSIKDFFSKCDQVRRKLRIWSHLLKKSLMENFIFCAVVNMAKLKSGELVENKSIFRYIVDECHINFR